MPKRLSRQKKLVCIVLILIMCGGLVFTVFSHTLPPIKIGILHSLTGTMAISERSAVDATSMAIDEINKSGGLLGRKIETVIIDGQSTSTGFVAGVEKLINTHQVSVIFGGWTSASRKSIKPLIEKYDQLLFYPVQYEGLEESHNIIYTGATPNQQLTPAVKWSVKHLGKRIFLASSDYVFPRAANTIMRKQIYALGAQVVGEQSILLGEKHVDKLIDAIIASKPSVILNTINGESNIAFFKSLSDRRVNIPVLSFSLSEEELQSMRSIEVKGHYVAASYFQSIQSEINKTFVTSIKKKYGADRVTSAGMEAAYLSVYLWSKAVVGGQSFDPSTIREWIKGETFLAPEGRVIVSSINGHLWKPFYIGKIQQNKQFNIIFKASSLIKPIPFPLYRTKTSWKKYLNSLYHGWGEKWAAEGIEKKELGAEQ